MHEGNLAFVPGAVKQPPLALAPAYDMLPMLYAPVRGVELPPRELRPGLPLPGERTDWLAASEAAITFWHRAAGDRRISAPMRWRQQRVYFDAVAAGDGWLVLWARQVVT